MKCFRSLASAGRARSSRLPQVAEALHHGAIRLERCGADNLPWKRRGADNLPWKAHRASIADNLPWTSYLAGNLPWTVYLAIRMVRAVGAGSGADSLTEQTVYLTCITMLSRGADSRPLKQRQQKTSAIHLTLQTSTICRSSAVRSPAIEAIRCSRVRGLWEPTRANSSRARQPPRIAQRPLRQIRQRPPEEEKAKVKDRPRRVCKDSSK